MAFVIGKDRGRMALDMSIAVGSLSTLHPTYLAASLSPADALRYVRILFAR